MVMIMRIMAQHLLGISQTLLALYLNEYYIGIIKV